jgi:cyclic pyranopterin phosphate synthase
MILLDHVETDITSACNNCCLGCDHYSGLLPPKFVPPEIIEKDLANLGKIAHTKEYSLLGGEPTLHPRLLQILDIAHASKFADEVQIITNGQTLRKQPEEFWQKIDSLWVTRYPGKLTDEDIAWIKGKCTEYGKPYLQKDRNILVKTFLDGPSPDDAAQRRFAGCHLKHCNIMDNGYLYLCCAAPFVAPLIMGLPEGIDGLKLEGATEGMLQAYLNRQSAFQGCKHCIEPLGIIYPWRETTRARWYEESKS